jgi:hypothetical protein
MVGSHRCSRPDLPNLRHACPRWHARFSWRTVFTAVPIFPTNLDILWRICIYTRICTCEDANIIRIVSAYRLDDRSWSPAEAKDFSFSFVSRSALRPTQPPIQWVLEVLSKGEKPGRGMTPIWSRGQEWVGTIFLSPLTSAWRSVTTLLYNFTSTLHADSRWRRVASLCFTLRDMQFPLDRRTFWRVSNLCYPTHRSSLLTPQLSLAHAMKHHHHSTGCLKISYLL